MQVRQWQRDYRQAVDRYYAMEQREPESEPEPEQAPETNGAGLCWCGMECRNRQHYAAHVQHDHYPEIAEYGSGVAARQEMAEKYADTISSAKWEFPALEWFNRARERDNG